MFGEVRKSEAGKRNSLTQIPPERWLFDLFRLERMFVLSSQTAWSIKQEWKDQREWVGEDGERKKEKEAGSVGER